MAPIKSIVLALLFIAPSVVISTASPDAAAGFGAIPASTDSLSEFERRYLDTVSYLGGERMKKLNRRYLGEDEVEAGLEKRASCGADAASTSSKKKSSGSKKGSSGTKKTQSGAKKTDDSVGDAVKELVGKVVPGALRITFYDEPKDLANPSCADWRLGNKWHPGNNHMTAAVTVSARWPNAPQCNSFLRVTNIDSGKSVVVRVVDSCAGDGCALDGNKTVDLTRKGFSSIADLDTGVLNNVKVEIVSKPGGAKWSAQDTEIYGPEHF